MREPLPVRFEARASREAERVDRWWRKNRLAAPDLFVHELEAGLEIVSTLPTIGAKVSGTRQQGIRRFLLRRMRYAMFAVVDSQGIRILAPWHGSRGSGPDL